MEPVAVLIVRVSQVAECDPFEVSDADTMLKYINADAKTPAMVTLFSKPSCPHCTTAKALLKSNGYAYEEIELGQNGVSFASLVNVTGEAKTPQIYIDGTHIGGADALQQFFNDTQKD